MNYNITTYNAGTFELIRALAGRYQPPRRSLLPYLLAILGAMAIAWPSVARADEEQCNDQCNNEGYFGYSFEGDVCQCLDLEQEVLVANE